MKVPLPTEIGNLLSGRGVYRIRVTVPDCAHLFVLKGVNVLKQNRCEALHLNRAKEAPHAIGNQSRFQPVHAPDQQ